MAFVTCLLGQIHSSGWCPSVGVYTKGKPLVVWQHYLKRSPNPRSFLDGIARQYIGERGGDSAVLILCARLCATFQEWKICPVCPVVLLFCGKVSWYLDVLNWTHLASDRDAAFAMTVFAKFWIAVITSISYSEVGGKSRFSGLFTGVAVQEGN